MFFSLNHRRGSSWEWAGGRSRCYRRRRVRSDRRTWRCDWEHRRARRFQCKRRWGNVGGGGYRGRSGGHCVSTLVYLLPFLAAIKLKKAVVNRAVKTKYWACSYWHCRLLLQSPGSWRWCRRATSRGGRGDCRSSNWCGRSCWGTGRAKHSSQDHAYSGSRSHRPSSSWPRSRSDSLLKTNHCCNALKLL